MRQPCLFFIQQLTIPVSGEIPMVRAAARAYCIARRSCRDGSDRPTLVADWQWENTNEKDMA